MRHAACGSSLLVAEPGGFRPRADHVRPSATAPEEAQDDIVSAVTQAGDVLQQSVA